MEDLMRVALSNAVTAAAMGAVVATLAPLLSRRPAVMHALWALVLLKLVTPPLFEIPVGRFEAEKATAEVSPLVPLEALDLDVMTWAWVDPPELVAFDPAVETPAMAEPPSWSFDAATAWRVGGGVWLAGALATAVLAGCRIVRFQRGLRDATPAGWAVEDEVAELSARMGLRRSPLVAVVDARVAPMLWGLGGRPRLILPRSLWKGLDARRRTLLLAHELAHLRRGDHLWRFLELAATVLYWWHPAVWWVRKAFRDAEERCCDAWVVWMFPDDARAYAETLLDTVDFLNPGAEPAPLLASGFGEVRHLRRRLTMVMRGTTPRTLGWKGSLAALGLAGVLLPMGPTWAQKANEAESLVSVTVTDDPFDGTVIVADRVEREGDVLTFYAEAVDGETKTIHALADGKLKTIHVDGPVAINRGADTIAVATVVDDEKDDPREEDDRKDKAEGRKMRFEFRGAPDQAREGIKKAVDELKGRIRELESKEPRGEDADGQIKALKSALEALEKLQAGGPGTINFTGPMPGDVIIARPDPFAAGRGDRDEKKLAAAARRVHELQQELARKQRETAETMRRLGEAQREMAEAGGGWAGFRPPAGFPFQAAPRVAEGRAILRAPDRAEDKERIDALEQKLDRVLKQLEGLNKPEPEGKDREQAEDKAKG